MNGSPLQLLEFLILAVCVAFGLRLALKPPVWREFRANYGIGVIALAVSIALASIALWASFRWPLIRHTLILAAALLLFFAWWRARPDYKRKMRWPPGSLGIGHSLDAIDDRDFYRSQSKRFGPVFKMSQFGRPVVCLLGLERGQRFLIEHRPSLAGASLPFNELIPSGFLRYMHAESHKAIAPLFRASFSTIALQQFESTIRDNFNRTLSSFARDSQRLPHGVNPGPYVDRAVFESLAYVLYGLAPADPRVVALHQLIADLSKGPRGGVGWRRRNRARLEEINSIMRQIQLGWPAEQHPSPSALRSLIEAQADAIENPVFAWNFIMISRNAFGDLRGLINWILKMCCDHPWALDDVRQWLDADPSSLQPNSDPAEWIVKETLRLEQSEYLYRKTAQRLEFEGFVVPKGWLVRLLIQESHRDPAVFPEPDRFDPGRFAHRNYTRAEYSPFGADAHGCMGFRLAGLLGQSFVKELANYDCSVLCDGPLERGSRHHHHWRPSSRLRLVLTQRAGPKFKA